MSIRNVVKVMNFHSLIRVDHAKRQADRYRKMEEQLMYMMDCVVNNRNLILDKRIFTVREDAPAINIYIGSDLGFCSNYNSQVSERLNQDSMESYKILIGLKLMGGMEKQAEIAVPYGELEAALPEIRAFLEEKIWNKECSSVNIIYNHYENTTTIYSRSLKIYPINRRQETEQTYQADFTIEGDSNSLMMKLTSSYVYYELLLALVNSRAAENVMRQNTTTESLKKIDELEEEQIMEERREKSEIEFQKVVENYVKRGYMYEDRCDCCSVRSDG